MLIDTYDQLVEEGKKREVALKAERRERAQADCQQRVLNATEVLQQAKKELAELQTCVRGPANAAQPHVAAPAHLAAGPAGGPAQDGDVVVLADSDDDAGAQTRRSH